MPKRKRSTASKLKRKIVAFAYRKRPYRKRLALKAHNFVERVEDQITLNASTLTTDGHLITNYSKGFKMTDIGQWQQYKELFDDYVLNKVVAEIRYDTFVSDNTYTNQSNPVYPQLLIKTDHNDVQTGASWNDLKESEKSRLVQLRPAGRPISHVIKPCILTQIYNTDDNVGYGSKWRQTIRTTDMDLLHFGLKIQVKTQPG
jgi:hypothetical protein